jgi:hypothetical protein
LFCSAGRRSADLKWEHGDILRVEVEGGALKITRVQTAYGHTMQIARKAMKQYRAVFEALAKT